MTNTEQAARIARMTRAAEAFGNSTRWNAIIDRAIAARGAK